MTRVVGGERQVTGMSVIGIDYVVEPGDWLTANLSLEEVPDITVVRQSDMFTLAKVVPGPGLRAELPISRNSIETDLSVLEQTMNEALVMIHRGRADSTELRPAPDQIQAVMTDYRNSCPWEISDHESGWVLSFETNVFKQKVHMSLQEQGVRLWIALLRFCEPDPVSLQALTHFFLGLNACLRMARASLVSEAMILEVILDERVLSVWRVAKAVEALVVGAQFAKRECGVLMNPNVAQAYCAFHHVPI